MSTSDLRPAQPAFVLVLAMNASIAHPTVAFVFPMFAAGTDWTVSLEFAMWTWGALLAVVPYLAMWARIANVALVSPLAMRTKQVLLLPRTGVHLCGIPSGQATLHLQQSPVLLATDLADSVGGTKFLKSGKKRFEKLQGWLKIGISKI